MPAAIVPIAAFLTHMRSEDALHRWDLVGDDDTSTALLGQQDLLNHLPTWFGTSTAGRENSAAVPTIP